MRVPCTTFYVVDSKSCYRIRCSDSRSSSHAHVVLYYVLITVGTLGCRALERAQKDPKLWFAERQRVPFTSAGVGVVAAPGVQDQQRHIYVGAVAAPAGMRMSEGGCGTAALGI